MFTSSMQYSLLNTARYAYLYVAPEQSSIYDASASSCGGANPRGNTCRTLTLILVVRRYASYTSQSPAPSFSSSAPSRWGGSVPSRMRGTPWYARRHAGPAMTTASPERRRMAVGGASRVSPPMRKIAAQPSLGECGKVRGVQREGIRDSRDGDEGRGRAEL